MLEWPQNDLMLGACCFWLLLMHLLLTFLCAYQTATSSLMTHGRDHLMECLSQPLLFNLIVHCMFQWFNLFFWFCYPHLPPPTIQDNGLRSCLGYRAPPGGSQWQTEWKHSCGHPLLRWDRPLQWRPDHPCSRGSKLLISCRLLYLISGHMFSAQWQQPCRKHLTSPCRQQMVKVFICVLKALVFFSCIRKQDSDLLGWHAFVSDWFKQFLQLHLWRPCCPAKTTKVFYSLSCFHFKKWTRLFKYINIIVFYCLISSS